MQQYQIQAFDATDENALARRMEVRPSHFEYVAKLKASGNFIMGGAILNDDGQMIGSTLFLQFETHDELDQYFENEPYISGKVWEQVRFFPFRMAVV
jgi:uncharacterized protein